MSNRFWIITTRSGYDIAFNKLVESIGQSIPFEQVIVLYSNAPEMKCLRNQEHKWIEYHTPKNIYEYYGFCLPAVLSEQTSIFTEVECQNFKQSKYLLIHDTVIAGGQFANKCQEQFNWIEQNPQYDVLWLAQNGAANLCVFNHNLSMLYRERLGDIHTVDKWTSIQMEHNHSHPLSVKSIPGIQQKFTPVAANFMKKEKIYSDVLRSTLHFSTIDVKKFYVHINGPTHEHPEKP